MRICLAAALWIVLALPAAAVELQGDGAGCTDKALGTKLAGLTDMDPEYIAIWAKGMQDQSCRGFGVGNDVTVDERDGDIACVRTAEDATCFWVRADMVP
jgi:hypothetical protein